MKIFPIKHIFRNAESDAGESVPLIAEPSDKKFNQYLAAVVVNLIGISWGTSMGWSSPAIVKMTDEPWDSPLDFIPTAEQLSWIGSILPIGGFIGIVFAPVPEWIGRKRSLLLDALIFVVSFCILSFARDLTWIYVARFLQGFASGVANVVLPMYLGEISSASCRGILSSFIQIGLVSGVLYVYCVGPYVTYFTFQLLCLVIPVVFLITFIFMPESPHYYMSKGDREGAMKSLQFLRQKNSEEVLEELDEIEHSVMESKTQKSGVMEVFKGANRTAFIISFGLICFQNFTGIDVIIFYSQTIFNKACSSLDSAFATVLIGAIMFLSSLISPFFVESTGRKKLLMISSAGMVVSHIVMGAYFFCDSRNLMNGLRWVPITALVSFILFFCVGFGPLPYTILGEMFSPEIKSVACFMAVSASWIVDFGSTKAFLPLETVVGNYGNFWIFGGFCALAFVFTATKVIETRGLSLREIQDKLNERQIA